MIDLYTSRRNKHEKAYFRFYDVKNKDTNRLIYETKPVGFIYVREINAKMLTREKIGMYFQFGNNEIVVETSDDASALKPNDLIKFRGVNWIVSNIQNKVIQKQTALGVKPSSNYYIALRSKDSGRNR